MKQSKEMGLQLVFLGTNDWESKDFLKKGGAAVEGAVFSTYFDPEAAITQNTEVFLKAYREKYGEDAEPPSEAALGFDAYMLALNAINTAGTSVKGESIRDQLAATKNFPGASGNITFDENGDPIKSVVIMTIINGEFVHIYTVEPAWQ
jgi:branched-chain amino acid transport system substrate-binding protein